MELDTHTRRKEDHDLLLFVLFEECVQNSYPCITLRHDVTLLQHIRCRRGFVIIDADVHRHFFQRNSRKILAFLRLSCTENYESNQNSGNYKPEDHCLSLLWDKLDNRFHFFLESNFKNPVGFIDTEAHQVLDHKVGSVSVAVPTIAPKHSM